MTIEHRYIFADHERLVGAVRHGRNLYRLLERLAEEKTAATRVAAAIVRARASWRWVFIETASVFGRQRIAKRPATNLVCKSIVNDAFVTGKRDKTATKLVLHI